MKVCEIDKVCLLVSSQCPKCGMANALNGNKRFWVDLNSMWAVGAPECIHCQAKLYVDDYLYTPEKATNVLPLKEILLKALHMGFLPDFEDVWRHPNGSSFCTSEDFFDLQVTDKIIQNFKILPWMLEERNLLPKEDEDE